MLQNITPRARRVVALASVAVLTAPAAFAQTTGSDDVGIQAITDLGQRAKDYGTAAFTVAVLVAGIFWGIRMMKKSFGAAK